MNGRSRILSLLLVVMLLLCLVPAEASAGAEIDKVTVRTEPSNPVVMTNIADIGVTVSSNNAYVASVAWYDANGALDTDKVDDCLYTVQIRVTPPTGQIFSAGVVGSINNTAVTVVRAEDGSYLDLSRTIQPALEAPTIWWSPKTETVDEGGLASFVATASPYYTKIEWNLISPEGSTTGIDTILSKFPGCNYGQDDSVGKLNIYNVTPAMNGWQVSCTFTGPGGSATTSKAKISVKGAVVATPTPQPTPEPPDDPQDATDTPVSDTHEHSFTGTWYSDDLGHWQQCDCGEEGLPQEHSLVWTETEKATKKKPGTEQGVCSVCGYSTERELEYQGGDKLFGLPPAVFYIAGGLLLLLLIIGGLRASYNRKYRRRKRRKSNNRYRRY